VILGTNWTRFLAFTCLLFVVSGVWLPAKAAAASSLTAFDLEPWLDGFIANALHTNKVAGAVVVVVKDGGVLIKKGYGFADIARRIPVDPDMTLFRPASISKTFTWTAVMQMVEAEKIDLDADINRYLDVQIDGKDGKPITMRHLMTHRAGFEEYVKGVANAQDLLPLDKYTKLYIPERVYTPGSTPSYSNYGTALAGYIVQRVSGMPFEQYVEQNIFAPLGLTNSSFRQPLPEQLRHAMAIGYVTSDDAPNPYAVMNDIPAGALASTGADMARFMIAHLQNEQPTGGLLLKPETARLMHRTIVRALPQINGMALGFFEADRNGHRALSHAGDLSFFKSDMNLFIDDNVGVFISMNSAGTQASDIRPDFITAFADRYFANATPDGTVDAQTAGQHAQQVAGSYLWSRTPESSFARLATLAFQATLVANPDRSLSFSLLGFEYRFREIAPYLWRRVDGADLLAVEMDQGRPTLMSLDRISGFIVFRPMPFLASATFKLPVLGLSLAILFLSLLSWPIAAYARGRYGVTVMWLPGEKRAFCSRHLAGVLMLLAVAAWIFLFSKILNLTNANDTQILLTQCFSIFSVVAATLLSVMTIHWTFKHQCTVKKILPLGLWALAMIFVLAQFYTYKLLKIGTLL
jgi:CubicO group peptidase (beta-lactamase class C family)